ncbi:MAG: hypothetical protein AAF376_14890, partial [Pseudomonadota bacterium]
MLWSRSSPKQAADNLRRTLCDLNARFADDPGILQTPDRFSVQLAQTVSVDRQSDVHSEAELLASLDFIDPALDDWLRDMRAADQPHPPSLPVPMRSDDSQTIAILIHTVTESKEAEQRFFTQYVSDLLAARFVAEGGVEVHFGSTPPDHCLDRGTCVLRIELASLFDDGDWSIRLRALVDKNRRFLWSGRTRLQAHLREIMHGHQLPAFVSNAQSRIISQFRTYRMAHESDFMRLQRAAGRLFTSNLNELLQAETELVDLSSEDGRAIALAWRAFGRLTQALEFAKSDNDLRGEAEQMMQEALTMRPENPLIAALASRVALELFGDVDRA